MIQQSNKTTETDPAVSSVNPTPPSDVTATTTSAGSFPKLVVALVLLACIIAALFYFFYPGSGEDKNLITHTVSRRTVRDVVVERGSLESQNTVRGRCDLPGWENKIIFIVPEGASVEKGQVVVRFDSERVDEQMREKKAEVNQAEGTVKESQQEISVQKNTNESNIAAAELAVKLADLDLKKYRDGDFEAEKADYKRAIDEGKAELEKLKEDLENIRILVKRGFRAPEQLGEIELRYESAKFRVDRDVLKLNNLIKYDRPRKIMEMEANAEETKRKLERAKDTAKAELEKAEAKLANAKQALEIQNQGLKELESKLANSEIKAPQPGTIVYANHPYMSDDERIREGATVYRWQDIFYLPDLRNMQVEVSVHESVVNKVVPKQKVIIRVDAYPDQTFSGTIKLVSKLATSSRNSSTKNYKVIVIIDDFPEDIELKPGMTAECEILVGTYKDIIAVPVNSVTEHFGKSYVYAKKNGKVERRRVEVGRTTTSFLEITEGISEGDELTLDAYQRGLADFGDAEQEAEAIRVETGQENATPEKAAPAGEQPVPNVASPGDQPSPEPVIAPATTEQAVELPVESKPEEKGESTESASESNDSATSKK